MASVCTSANDINNNQSSEDSFDNIWVAATNGDVDVVRNFLLTGIDVNIQDENTGNSPIHSAASYGQVEMIEFLIENGADVNLKDADGDTPILLCEDRSCFEVLEQNGADLTVSGFTEKAMELAEEGNRGMVSFLFSRGLIPVNISLQEQYSINSAMVTTNTSATGVSDVIINNIVDGNNHNDDSEINSPSQA